MDRKIIKEEAKNALKDRWLMYFVILALVGIVSGATAAILTPVLGFGVYLIALDVLNGKELNVNRFGDIFKDLNHLLKLIGVFLLTTLIIFVGFLFFMVPGIILSYMLSQSLHIMMDNPDITIKEALTRSKDMMAGYKFNLFVFQLSFVGHILLTIITFGIYSIYFGPLYSVASVNYYKHLKEVTNNNVVEVEVLN